MRYIDADKTDDVIRKLKADDHYISEQREKSIYKMLSFFPTEDVVEVVRCKDCYFAEPIKGTVGFYTCMSGLLVGENHFCSYGKRREDEQIY